MQELLSKLTYTENIFSVLFLSEFRSQRCAEQRTNENAVRIVQ